MTQRSKERANQDDKEAVVMVYQPPDFPEIQEVTNPAETNEPAVPPDMPMEEQQPASLVVYRLPLAEILPERQQPKNIYFCKLHGFAAHARRRNGTVSACGVRIEDIRQHLWKTVDGLQSISKSKVYNLRQPRRSNTKEASNHKNGVDVSVGKKNTDISNDHQDLRTFFPNDDSPHYKDHDFPVPDQSYSTDELGRKSHKYPATGPLWVVNRAVKHHSASVFDHISDVRNILKLNPDLRKPIQVFITDGDPNWTPKSSLTVFFLGRFWKEENLDMVISCTNICVNISS
ncbi:uncharacterized protein LOC143068171 [Mytilus galloprovincialis]|uniref:uncharacterized protein LOC143068171 n=1 Tax=Mytilus galloprovincialis TaxID=29158 RepID=UPI003F7B5AD9